MLGDYGAFLANSAGVSAINADTQHFQLVEAGRIALISGQQYLLFIETLTGPPILARRIDSIAVNVLAYLGDGQGNYMGALLETQAATVMDYYLFSTKPVVPEPPDRYGFKVLGVDGVSVIYHSAYTYMDIRYVYEFPPTEQPTYPYGSDFFYVMGPEQSTRFINYYDFLYSAQTIANIIYFGGIGTSPKSFLAGDDRNAISQVNAPTGIAGSSYLKFASRTAKQRANVYAGQIFTLELSFPALFSGLGGIDHYRQFKRQNRGLRLLSNGRIEANWYTPESHILTDLVQARPPFAHTSTKISINGRSYQYPLSGVTSPYYPNPAVKLIVVEAPGFDQSLFNSPPRDGAPVSRLWDPPV